MTPRILLVMPPDRQSRLLPILTPSGMQVATASSTAEARSKLAEPQSFDLVFSDAELPDGSWRDLLRELEAARRDCDMVVCARLADEGMWLEMIESGVFDLIPEPYDRREVLRIVRSALDNHHARFAARHSA